MKSLKLIAGIIGGLLAVASIAQTTPVGKIDKQVKVVVGRSEPLKGYALCRDPNTLSSFYAFTGLVAHKKEDLIQFSDANNQLSITFHSLKYKRDGGIYTDAVQAVTDIAGRMVKEYKATIIKGLSFEVGDLKSAAVNFKWQNGKIDYYQNDVFIDGPSRMYRFSLIVPWAQRLQITDIFEYMVSSFRTHEYDLAVEAAKTDKSIKIVPFGCSVVDIKGLAIKFMVPESFNAIKRRKVYYFEQPLKKYYITFKPVAYFKNGIGFKDSKAFITNLYRMMSRSNGAEVVDNAETTVAGMKGWRLLFKITTKTGELMQYDVTVDGPDYIYSFSLIAEKKYYQLAYQTFSHVINSVSVDQVATASKGAQPVVNKQ